MNSRNLFYVRNLQAKFYFKKNEIVRSLFFLENYLFSLPKQTEEILVVKLRVKWIYDQIKVDNFTNELTTNFIVFKDSILKEKILTFIDYFSQTLEEKKIENIFKTFKKLNKEFNSIISFSGSDFRSSVYFQIFQYMYKEDFKNRNELQNFFSNSRLKINDHFEEVFIKTFLKFFLKKKKKKLVRLSIYFIYCYVFLIKMKATLPRLLFIIILNILLYATLTFNINFSYLIVNLIIIFLFYELHIYKKIINKKIDELKKITDNNASEINYLPASEHPIIKAAKKRFKN